MPEFVHGGTLKYAAKPATISRQKFLGGSTPEIILIGAHYDSVFGSPGANDNGSGVAAMLALARRFAGKTGKTHDCDSSGL